MPRRFRINGPLLTGLLATALVLSLFIGWPLLIERITGVEPDTAVSRSIAEVIRERGITAVAGLWFFVFGATIGSFLNVVAYRMPMGLTIVSKPSRCPYCETPILFRHNMPIFGWLALRGRCNACRLPISIRYPLVEVIVGALFFILVWRELVSGGANLPIEFHNARPGIMWNVLSPNWRLIGLYFFHAFLIGVLATIALIKLDRLRIPAKLGWFAIIVAVACRAIWPSLNVIAWWSPSAVAIGFPAPWGRIFDPLIGLVVGALVGWATHHIIETHRWTRSNSSQSGVIAITSIVGACLGWQIVVPFLVTASLVQFFTMLVARIFGKSSEVMWAASCLWATMIVIGIWKHLPLLGLPGPSSSVIAHEVWLFIGLSAAFVATRFSRA